MQSMDICVGRSNRAEQSPVAGVEVVPLVAGAAPIVVGGPVVSLYQNKQVSLPADARNKLTQFHVRDYDRSPASLQPRSDSISLVRVAF